MKRSELRQKIEEIITELLNEDTVQYTDDKGEETIANLNPSSPEGLESIETLKKDSKIKKVINVTKNQKLKE